MSWMVSFRRISSGLASASLLVYQISARFSWHRALATLVWRLRSILPLVNRARDRHDRQTITAASKTHSAGGGRRVHARASSSARSSRPATRSSSFANGKEAHERLKEEPFTLLLTDIVMPQMDGIELARRASEIDPDLKIMFITGFAAVTLNTDSKAVKDARVLSKPFHLKDLVREIDRLLAA